jgi:hypothetical protein
VVTFFSTHNRGEGALQHLLYIAFFVTLCGTVDRREQLLRWLVYAATAVCCYGVFELAWHSNPGPWSFPRFQGNLGNPLYVGSLMVFALWASLKLRWWHMTGVFLVAMVASQSKGALLGLAVGVTFWLWHTRREWLGCAATALICIGMVTVQVPMSGTHRIALWHVAVRGILERPWGWGAENYGLVWDRYFIPLKQAGGFPSFWHDRAHSMVLDRSIEWGVVGMLAFVALLLLAFWKGGALERAAFAAYGVQAIFMFDMMPAMVGVLCLTAYCFLPKEETLTDLQSRGAHWYRTTGWHFPQVASQAISAKRRALALVLGVLLATTGGLALYQGYSVARAETYSDLLEAAEAPSPIGGFGSEVAIKYLQQRPQNERSVAAVEGYLPEAGPSRTTFLHLLCAHRLLFPEDVPDCPCEELLTWAPYRGDSQEMCKRIENLDKPAQNGILGIEGGNDDE